jgi:hypothetical protein
VRGAVAAITKLEAIATTLLRAVLRAHIALSPDNVPARNTGQNEVGVGYRSEAKRSNENSDIVEILKFFTHPQRQALHGQEVLGMRDINSQVAQLFVYFEAAISAEVSLHGIVQPVVRQTLFLRHRLRGIAQLSGRNQESVDVFGRRARLKHEAHGRPTGKIRFTPYPPSGQHSSAMKIVHECAER